MAQSRKRPDAQADDAATHHSRYPTRLHEHLAGAVEAAARLSGIEEGEADVLTPDQLLGRYGGDGEPQGGTSE